MRTIILLIWGRITYHRLDNQFTMAARPKGYGMTAELKDKIDSKYDPKLEAEARGWIEAVVAEPLPGGAFADALNDGKVLCKLINKLHPGSVKKINDSKMAFKKMENIGNFLEAAGHYGLPKSDSFQTVDLYEAENMPQVINTIHALGRVAQKKGYAGKTLGVKESEKCARDFDPQQQKIAGQSVIGLQMGSNRGASQAGMTPYGLARQVEKTNLKN